MRGRELGGRKLREGSWRKEIGGRKLGEESWAEESWGEQSWEKEVRERARETDCCLLGISFGFSWLCGFYLLWSRKEEVETGLLGISNVILYLSCLDQAKVKAKGFLGPPMILPLHQLWCCSRCHSLPLIPSVSVRILLIPVRKCVLGPTESSYFMKEASGQWVADRLIRSIPRQTSFKAWKIRAASGLKRKGPSALSMGNFSSALLWAGILPPSSSSSFPHLRRLLWE